MPDPKKYKSEKEWMSACMPHLLHIEKKKRDQAIAQCLGMWRQWKKKADDPKNKVIARRVIAAFLERNSARILSPGDALKKDRELERWRENLDKTPTPSRSKMPPYKEGEIINVLVDGKFVEMPYSKDMTQEKFYYLLPKTKEIIESKPVKLANAMISPMGSAEHIELEGEESIKQNTRSDYAKFIKESYFKTLRDTSEAMISALDDVGLIPFVGIDEKWKGGYTGALSDGDFWGGKIDLATKDGKKVINSQLIINLDKDNSKSKVYELNTYLS